MVRILFSFVLTILPFQKQLGQFRKMIKAKIIAVDVKDIRFPTSLNHDGSDAMVWIIKQFAASVILLNQQVHSYIHIKIYKY